MDRLPTSLQCEVKKKLSPVWSPFCLLGKYFLNLTTNCGRAIDEQTVKKIILSFIKQMQERGVCKLEHLPLASRLAPYQEECCPISEQHFLRSDQPAKQ